MSKHCWKSLNDLYWTDVYRNNRCINDIYLVYTSDPYESVDMHIGTYVYLYYIVRNAFNEISCARLYLIVVHVHTVYNTVRRGARYLRFVLINTRLQ